MHTSPRMKYATGAMGQYLCLPPYSSVLGVIPGDRVRGVRCTVCRSSLALEKERPSAEKKRTKLNVAYPRRPSPTSQ